MTLEFLSLHTNDYACWEGNAEQKRHAAHAPYMQCSALPSQHAYSFVCKLRNSSVTSDLAHIYAYFECDIVRVAILYGDDSFVASV